MAKVRTKPVLIPDKVQVSVNEQEIMVKGPLGELNLIISKNVKVELKDKAITVMTANDSIEAQYHQGTTRTLILNMIKGVTEGYSKTLVVQGTGYRAQLVTGGLQLFLGFTKPVTISIPSSIKVELQTVKSADKGDLTNITLKGIDKQLVGDIAAKIKKVRVPDPYKHKGIRYANEVIRKKVGKRAVAQAT
ncbi:MAG: 50S ribosomal protein L6 [bacterium]